MSRTFPIRLPIYKSHQTKVSDKKTENVSHRVAWQVSATAHIVQSATRGRTRGRGMVYLPQGAWSLSMSRKTMFCKHSGFLMYIRHLEKQLACGFEMIGLLQGVRILR